MLALELGRVVVGVGLGVGAPPAAWPQAASTTATASSSR
jgi:hypothetical protein